MSSPLRALTSRNYRLFFIGQGISLIGSWMTRLATSWLVYRLTDSEFLLGVVAFAGQAPSLILPPLAGVWLDRYDRHKVLIVVQVLAMAQSLAMAALTLSDLITIPWIIGRVRRMDGALVTPGIVRAKKQITGGEWDQVGETFHVGTDGLFWVCAYGLIGVSQVQIEYSVGNGRIGRLQVPMQGSLTVIPFVIDP